MAELPVVQHSFSAGALDTGMYGRVDTKAYLAGAAHIENQFLSPLGGSRLREGFRWMANNSEPLRTIDFQFSRDQVYEIGFGDQVLHVFVDGVLSATKTTPYSYAKVRRLRFAQSGATLLIFSGDYQIKELNRGTSHSDWTLSDIEFFKSGDGEINQPYYNFHPSNIELQPSGTTGSVTLTAFNGYPFVADHVGLNFKIKNKQVVITEVLGTTGSLLDLSSQDTYGNMTDGSGLDAGFDGLQQAQGSSPISAAADYSSWIAVRLPSAKSISYIKIFATTNGGFIFGSSGATNITFDVYGKNGSPPTSGTDGVLLGSEVASNEFASPVAVAPNDQITQYEYLVFNVSHANTWRYQIGEIEVYEVAGATEFAQAKATVLQTLDDTERTSDWSEPVFSAVRGYSIAGGFHQGRLMLVGPESAPNYMAVSNSGDYFNFVVTDDQLDNESFSFAIDADEFLSINSVASLNDMILFTTGGIWVLPSADTLTPKNFVPPIRYHDVSIGDIDSDVLEGALLFVGKTLDDTSKPYTGVFEFSYDKDKGYQLEELSLLIPDYIRNPVDIAVRRGTHVDASSNLFVVNSDGTLAVLTTLRNKGVTGWTLITIDGEFNSACVAAQELYVTTKRTLNTIDKYFLERLEPGYLFDLSKQAYDVAGNTTFSGFDHLNGLEVDVLADGAYYGKVVVTGGTVVLDTVAYSIECGFNWSWELKLLPAHITTSNFTLAGKPYRVRSVTVQVRNLGVFYVNGKQVPSRFATFGSVAEKESAFITRPILGVRGGRNRNYDEIVLSGDASAEGGILSVSRAVVF